MSMAFISLLLLFLLLLLLLLFLLLLKPVIFDTVTIAVGFVVLLYRGLNLVSSCVFVVSASLNNDLFLFVWNFWSQWRHKYSMFHVTQPDSEVVWPTHKELFLKYTDSTKNGMDLSVDQRWYYVLKITNLSLSSLLKYLLLLFLSYVVTALFGCFNTQTELFVVCFIILCQLFLLFYIKCYCVIVCSFSSVLYS